MRVKSLDERKVAIRETFPMNFDGGPMLMPIPQYTGADRTMQKDAMAMGITTDDGRLGIVATAVDYEVFVSWLARTPTPEDATLVFRCLLRQDFAGLTLGEIFEHIEKLTGLDPAIANTVLVAMKENGLILTPTVGREPVLISYVSHELLDYAPPRADEEQAINEATRRKPMKLSDLSRATGIPEMRLREIKGYTYSKRFLKIYTGQEQLPGPLEDYE